jgi:hypothetical protein
MLSTHQNRKEKIEDEIKEILLEMKGMRDAAIVIGDAVIVF